MTERDRSKVTLVLSEADARWLAVEIEGHLTPPAPAERILHEIKHALAECGCSGEVGR